MANKPMDLSIGSKFNNFEEVLQFLKCYQKEKKELFTIRNSKTIKNSHLAGTVDEKLKYVSVEYACKFGGSQVRTVAKERETSTYKLGCPAMIKIKLTGDKQGLEVSDLNLVHKYHPESKVFYNTLPEVRRLSPTTKAETIKALKIDSNPKLIQSDLAAGKQKFVKLKDLANLKATTKSIDDNSLEKAVVLLKDKFGCEISIFHDTNLFKGLYFSTSDMRKSMSSWPEIVLIDGTYKLLNMNLTVMIFLVHDGNGRGEVVGVGLISSEDAPTLQWLAETFKKQNFVACKEMKCMMTDKDMTERNALKEVFPGIPIYFCLFHTLKTFGRTVTTDKMKITRAERDECLKLLEKMAYSSSEQEYDKLYDEFTEVAPETIRHYFDTNWHPLRAEWTVHNMTQGNLNIRTNNQLESINGKIKQVVRRNSSLCDFVERFFQWLRSHNQETDFKLAKQFLKRPTSAKNYEVCESEYSQLLTDHAYRKVLAEIKGHKAITFRQCNRDSRECMIAFGSTNFLATPSSCECPFRKSSALPCKHILAVRRMFEMSLFDKELCGKGWTKDFTKEHQRAFRVSTVPFEDQVEVLPSVTGVAAPRRIVRSIGQKRKVLSAVTSELVHLGSLSCNEEFDDKLRFLQDTVADWRKGIRRVVPLNSESDKNGNLTQNDVSNLESSMTSLTFEVGEVSESARVDDSNKIDTIPSNSTPTIGNSSHDLAGIQMPSSIRVVGRPCGFLSTTIGKFKSWRPAKSFAEQSHEDKVRIVLGWCIYEDILTAVLNREFLIDTETINNLTVATLHDSIISESVDIEIIKDYFEKLAFKQFKRIVAAKKSQCLRKCTVCKCTLANRSIECQSCLLWYDLKCVNLKRTPSSRKVWFCLKCNRK